MTDRPEIEVQEENYRQRMIALANAQVMELLEQKKCPPSILRELIRQGGITGSLEQERLETANELNRRKAESIRNADESKETADKAIEAMRSYYGN